jgi:hypothetical protein
LVSGLEDNERRGLFACIKKFERQMNNYVKLKEGGETPAALTRKKYINLISGN